jgi:hypothetical protein
MEPNEYEDDESIQLSDQGFQSDRFPDLSDDELFTEEEKEEPDDDVRLEVVVIGLVLAFSFFFGIRAIIKMSVGSG